MQQQQMLWQTRTIASFIAATVRVPEGETTSELLEQALKIGEGVLVSNDDKKEDDDTYFGHKYNSYEDIQRVFGGQGNVQMTRAG